MEIKLNGLEAGIIMGCVILEAAIGLVALHHLDKETERADEAEFKAAVYDFDRFVKGIQIDRLTKENEELKSKLNAGGES